MLGMTWERTLNGALDEIGRLHTERDNALDALLELTKTHPELENDPNLMLACMALL
jgi:hypothetical protein